MIYFIRDSFSGYVKVGYAKHNPGKRLKELQCGCPGKLTLEATAPGTVTQEQFLHAMICRNPRGLHVRGEWFDLTAGEVSILAAALADDVLVECCGDAWLPSDALRYLLCGLRRPGQA